MHEHGFNRMTSGEHVLTGISTKYQSIPCCIQKTTLQLDSENPAKWKKLERISKLVIWGP